MGRARHGMRRLAAPGGASPRQVPGGITPSDLTLFPGDTDQFGDDAVYVVYRLRSEIPDSRLNVEPAVRPDDKEPIESNRAANVAATRDADAAPLRSASLWEIFPFIPLERLRAPVKRFLQERARSILLFPVDERPEFCLPPMRVDLADGHLINRELSRGLCKLRLQHPA